MKTEKVFLLILFAIVMSLSTYAQLGTATATYSIGDIETDKYFYNTNGNSSCPGLMTVTLPTDALILYTDVSYNMTSDENSAVNKQRSHLRCVTAGGTNEASITKGPYVYEPGTESYSRTGLDIANGITSGGDVDFELHAGASYYRHHCSPDSVKVDNNTWTVTITYIPSGYPMQSLNPNPVDAGAYVGLDDDLTWEFGADTDTYDVFFGTDNPPTTKLIDNAAAGTNGTFDPGTMDETTTYYWQVVSRNSNGHTDGPVWEFTTVCGSFLTPFTEDFESTTAPELPYCWTKIVNSSSTAYLETNGYYGNQGGSCINMGNNDDATATLIFISPQVDVGTGSLADKMVHLYVKGGDYPNLSIGTMSDPTDESTFTSYETILCWQNYKEHDIYLNDYVGTDTYIAFKLDVNSSYKTAQIDDITIGDMPTCLRPEDLSADNLSTNSAMLSWTDLNGASAWNVEYGLAGFTPTGIPTVSGVSNPHEITGLTSATDYDFYVQTDCGSGDLSTWSSVGTFLTPCDFYDVPFSENFDGVGWGEMPSCWSSILLCADGFVWNGNQGGYFQMQNGGDDNSTLMLISPPVLDIAPNRLKFDAQSSMEGSELIIGTMSNPADQSTFDSLTSITFTSAYTYESFDVWLNAYTGTDQYFVMKHSNNTTQLTFQIDNIEIEALPSCLEPVDLYVNAITASSANFNWTESGDATFWKIEIGELGFAQGTGTTHIHHNETETNLTYNLSGLTSATAYDVYISAHCGAGDNSIWLGPVSFLSGFDAIGGLPITEDFESGLGITGNDFRNIQDWVIDTDLQHGGLSSAHNAYTANDDNVLFILGTFDFTTHPDLMLSFWQIAKTDGQYDHCYVEISTDGGTTFDQLPESTYAGAGRYREDDLYAPFDGPCFDEDSYLDWGTSNTIPENTWWKKEYFNLTDYNIYDNVVIRFRLASNAYTNRDGWYIDDIAIETSELPSVYVNPISITEQIDPLAPIVNVELALGNSGGFPAGYTANVIYDELELMAANFDSGIPSDWTIINNGSNNITWVDTTGISGQSFDGTPFAWVDGLQGYLPPVENIMDEELISPSVDASAYAGGTLKLEYDQVFDADYNVGDTAKVYVYDGSNWVMIYESWTDDGSIYSGGVHKTWDVTAYANADFQVKFHYIEGSVTKRGRLFAIDNVKLRASMSALDWLSLDGESTVSGVTLPDVDETISMINVQLDATTLGSIENYTADIEVYSTDTENALIIIPVRYWNPISSAVITASPDEICNGETTELSVDLTGGSGAQTYLWTSNPAGFTSSLANPFASPTETTTYYVEITEETISVSGEVLVSVSQKPTVSLETFEDLCINGGELVLTGGLPTGGTYSGNGIDNGIFDPTVAGEGIHEISYTNANEFGCDSTATSTLNVMALPLVTLDVFEDMCIDEGELELIGGLPLGGTYSGNGVENGIFDPVTAGEGVHAITYTYLNAEGCENFEASNITVFPLPEVDLGLFEDVCIDESAFVLTGGSPEGGEYSGVGVDNGMFDPQEAGIGTHTITYTYTDGNQCENFAEGLMIVDACTGVIEIVENLTIEVSPNPNSGKFSIMISTAMDEKISLKVIDNLGSVVYKKESVQINKNYSTDLDLSNQPKGMYFVYISTDDNNYVKKIIVQ